MVLLVTLGFLAHRFMHISSEEKAREGIWCGRGKKRLSEIVCQDNTRFPLNCVTQTKTRQIIKFVEELLKFPPHARFSGRDSLSVSRKPILGFHGGHQKGFDEKVNLCKWKAELDENPCHSWHDSQISRHYPQVTTVDDHTVWLMGMPGAWDWGFCGVTYRALTEVGLPTSSIEGFLHGRRAERESVSWHSTFDQTKRIRGNSCIFRFVC